MKAGLVLVAAALVVAGVAASASGHPRDSRAALRLQPARAFVPLRAGAGSQTLHRPCRRRRQRRAGHQHHRGRERRPGEHHGHRSRWRTTRRTSSRTRGSWWSWTPTGTAPRATAASTTSTPASRTTPASSSGTGRPSQRRARRRCRARPPPGRSRSGSTAPTSGTRPGSTSTSRRPGTTAQSIGDDAPDGNGIFTYRLDPADALLRRPHRPRRRRLRRRRGSWSRRSASRMPGKRFVVRARVLLGAAERLAVGARLRGQGRQLAGQDDGPQRAGAVPVLRGRDPRRLDGEVASP